MTIAVEGPTCNAHHWTEPVLQAWGSQGAWCEAGMSGAHLVHADCEWSKGAPPREDE
jgi:hypothetical protein